MERKKERNESHPSDNTEEKGNLSNLSHLSGEPGADRTRRRAPMNEIAGCGTLYVN
jgi:hypothetical protein